MSKLNKAIKSGNLERVRFLITSGQARLRETSGTIALSQAVDLEHLEIVQLLIQAGVEVNDEDKIMYPSEAPIAIACARGNLEIVRLLLQAGSQLNIPSDDPEYWTPLMYAVNSRKIEVVKQLVEAKADVNQIRDGGNFALLIATENNDTQIFEYLAPLTNLELRRKASLHLRNAMAEEIGDAQKLEQMQSILRRIG